MNKIALLVSVIRNAQFVKIISSYMMVFVLMNALKDSTVLGDNAYNVIRIVLCVEDQIIVINVRYKLYFSIIHA